MSKKVELGLGAVSAFVMCVSVGAQNQEPRPSTPNQPTRQADAGQTERTVSVVGCLQRDATPGASSANSTANAMFKLTSVQPASAASASGGATGGRSSGVGDPGEASRGRGQDNAASGGRMSGTTSDNIATEYRLTAASGVDLAAHANHRMQLTGTVTPAGKGPTVDARGGANANPSTPNAAGQAGRSEGPAARDAMPMPAPTLHVTAVTMVAASCQ